MANIDTRRKLIETTKEMLLTGMSPSNLTARKISSEAETNLAMINYCFKSKDELIKLAVEEIIAEEFKKYSHDESEETPKAQLRNLLGYVCQATIKYQDLTKLSIPYLLLEEELKMPLEILPYIKKHYGSQKSELECKLLAFQLVYSLQLIFYRSDDFSKYSGINIDEIDQLKKLIDVELDLFLKD